MSEHVNPVPNGTVPVRSSMEVLQSIESSLESVVRMALSKAPQRKQQSDDVKDLD